MGFVEPDGGLGQRVVMSVADATDGGPDSRHLSISLNLTLVYWADSIGGRNTGPDMASGFARSGVEGAGDGCDVVGGPSR
jgi:hypothetical protein